MVLERVVISEFGVVDESLPLLLNICPCLFDLITGGLVSGSILDLVFASTIQEDFASTATIELFGFVAPCQGTALAWLRCRIIVILRWREFLIHC